MVAGNSYPSPQESPQEVFWEQCQDTANFQGSFCVIAAGLPSPTGFSAASILISELTLVGQPWFPAVTLVIQISWPLHWGCLILHTTEVRPVAGRAVQYSQEGLGGSQLFAGPRQKPSISRLSCGRVTKGSDVLQRGLSRWTQELLSLGEALLRNSSLELLSIVKPFTYSLPVVILFKRSVKRSLGKYWGTSYRNANLSVPCRHKAKSIPTRLIYCWSFLSVPVLGYHLTLSLPFLSATTSDSLGNASIKRCGRGVRQSEGIRTSAWWCVNLPSESLMLMGEEGLPGTWHEREPLLHQTLISNWSAGLSAPFFSWALCWKRPWEKTSQN